MSEIKFSTRAYCKIILHASKYPHCAVNGVLLSKATQKGKELEFVDAVPLFHIALNLTPMAEIALMQIDEVYGKQGLVISGYYTALEHPKDNSFDKAHHRISDRIANNFPGACLVVLDNEKLSLQLDSLALKVAQYVDSSYKSVDPQRVYLTKDNGLDVCSNLLEKNAHSLLVDFDNHLDNVQRDWLNHDLNEEIDNVAAIYNN